MAAANIHFVFKGYALIHALKREESLLEISAIVKAYPDSIRTEDSLGRLPLHVACHYKPSIEVVRFFILQYADSIHIRTKDGTAASALCMRVQGIL